MFTRTSLIVPTNVSNLITLEWIILQEWTIKKCDRTKLQALSSRVDAICHATPHFAAASSLCTEPEGKQRKPTQIFIFITSRDF